MGSHVSVHLLMLIHQIRSLTNRVIGPKSSLEINERGAYSKMCTSGYKLKRLRILEIDIAKRMNLNLREHLFNKEKEVSSRNAK